MAQYCSVADVQTEFKNLQITSNSFITTTTVSNLIDEASAYIDSCVGTRYVTPITGAISLNLFRMLAKVLVAERVRTIIGVSQKTNTDANPHDSGGGFTVADAMHTLQEIMDGVMPLNDSTLLLASAGFQSNNFNMGVNPRFKKSLKQW